MLFKDNGTFFSEKHNSDEVLETVNIPALTAPNLKLLDACCSAFSPDGKMFAYSIIGCYAGVLCAEEGKTLDFSNFLPGVKSCSKLIDCGDMITSMIFLPIKLDGQYCLATGLKKGPIKILNTATGKVNHVLFDHTARVTALTFAPEFSLLLSSCHDKTMKIWDMLDNGNMCQTLRHHIQPINFTAFNPSDQKIIASVGNAREVYIWELKDKRRLSAKPYKLIGHKNDVNVCDWSRDGALLVTCSNDSTAIVWDVAEKTILLTLGHSYPMPSSIYMGGANGSWVSSAAFSKCGTKIITTCEDKKARIWNIWDVKNNNKNCTSSKPYVQEVSFSKMPLKCVFDEQGNFASVGLQDGSVKVVKQNLETTNKVSSLQHLCRQVTRVNKPMKELDVPFFTQAYLKYKCP